MTVKEEILEAITLLPGLTDTELEKQYGRSHQTINIACRALVSEGLIERRPNPDKAQHLGNYPTGRNREKKATLTPITDGELSEDHVKEHISQWLQSQGWSVQVAWGKNHGVDIEAWKDDSCWRIEVKGPGSRQAMRHNYFLSILGETLQRMDRDDARYSIAFPDMAVYRGLWARLPALAKQRTGIDMILVSEDGTIRILD